MFPVTRRGQHWLVFHMGPQGQWGFISQVIQEVSPPTPQQGLAHDHGGESNPSLYQFSVLSSPV